MFFIHGSTAELLQGSISTAAELAIDFASIATGHQRYKRQRQCLRRIGIIQQLQPASAAARQQIVGRHEFVLQQQLESILPASPFGRKLKSSLIDIHAADERKRSDANTGVVYKALRID